MHRFFISPENINGDRVFLRGADVSHIRTVLRLGVGDLIHVLDGRGSRYSVRLTQVARKEIIGKIISREEAQTESPLEILMGQALIKGNKFDKALRASVELGVCKVVPLQTERTVVKILPADAATKILRWQNLAACAAKQSGRSLVPQVEPVIWSPETFCRESREYDLKLIFWEGEEAARLKNLNLPKPPRSIAFLTGPEGGFSSAEIAAARQFGFQTVKLGPRILRAETAPLAVLALLQNLWGDL